MGLMTSVPTKLVIRKSPQKEMEPGMEAAAVYIWENAYDRKRRKSRVVELLLLWIVLQNLLAIIIMLSRY